MQRASLVWRQCWKQWHIPIHKWNASKVQQRHGQSFLLQRAKAQASTLSLLFRNSTRCHMTQQTTAAYFVGILQNF